MVMKTHPDKNCGDQATEETKVLNDAKEMAISYVQACERGDRSGMSADQIVFLFTTKLGKQTEGMKQKSDTKHEEPERKRPATPVAMGECQLVGVRAGAEQRLAEMTVLMEHERRLKVDAEKRLAEVMAKMVDERRADDTTRRQLAQMTAAMERERGLKDDAEKLLAQVTDTMADERRLKDGVEKRLAEMTAAMEGERMANNASRKQLIKMATKMQGHHKAKKSAELRLAEMEKKMDDERKAKDDTNEQLVGENDAGSSNIKKRKKSSEKTETRIKSVQLRVQEFVNAHITGCPGNFITTRAINDAFVAGYSLFDSSIVTDCRFQKLLKSFIIESFSDQPGFSYTRVWCNGGHPRGYAGLSFLK
jgi:hypothetical protein